MAKLGLHDQVSEGADSMRKTALALLTLLAAPLPAASAEVLAGPQFSDNYPRRALRLSLEGKAVLACTLGEGGSLRDCKVESETPEGYDFGIAALKMAPSIRMRSTGAPVGARVHVPVEFRLPPEPYLVPEPIWLQRPTAEELTAAYPKVALRRRPSAEVILTCPGNPDGSLGPCVVLSEQPAGLGFGAAAISIVLLLISFMVLFVLRYFGARAARREEAAR